MGALAGGVAVFGGAAWLIVFVVLGAYVAEKCEQSTMCGVAHGVIFGPLGLILVSLYPRPTEVTLPASRDDNLAGDQLLAEIRDELRWQRAQKEKEIVRARQAAQKGSGK